MIIDEISMVSSQMMDYIHQFMCRMRKDGSAPRLLFFGDVMQLPPVINMNNPEIKEFYDKYYNGNIMFFHSKYYKNYQPRVISLYKSYRQNDPDFIEALTNIAIGDYEQTNLDYLNQQVMSLPTYEKTHKSYIYLTPTNAVADKRNNDYLKSLTGASMTYKATYSKNFPENKKPTDDIITIKEGAQVMCTMNNRSRDDPQINYRNGTVGIVKHVDPNYVEIEDENGKTIQVVKTRITNYKMCVTTSGKTKHIYYEPDGWYEQIDCKIARACTIHKSQSKSFDNAYIALMGWVPESITYVGLSRLRTLSGLGLNRAITPNDIKIYKESLNFLAGVEEDMKKEEPKIIENGDDLI
jgi:ATP-dependent exoDNAse (exonuclease V) alpha subunit